MSEEKAAHSTKGGECADFLCGMSRALEGARLLGIDHPGTARAISDASRCLTSPVRVAVAGATFEVDGAALADGARHRALHERLRELDVAFLEVPATLGEGVLKAVVSALAERGSERGRVEAINAAGAGMLRVTPVDYSRLSTSGGSGEGGTVTALVHSMLAGDVTTRAASVEDRFPQGREQEFSGDFARTAEWIESLGTDAQAGALTNLKPLLSTLSERFRSQLLSPENTHAASWRVLASVADAIPTGDVERALRSLNEKPVQMSLEAAAVFAKLSSTLPEGSAAAPHGRAVTEVACETLCAEEADLAERLASVLRVH